jgi:hypothetical protein
MKNAKKRTIPEICPAMIKFLNNLGSELVKVANSAIVKAPK